MDNAVIYSKKKLEIYKNYEILHNIYLLSNNLINQATVSGSGIFNNEFLYSDNNFINNKPFINKDNIENVQINMRGSLCIFTKSSDDKSFFIIPDSLGSAIVFYYDSPNLKVFSNSINKIVEILKNLNINVKKNILYQFETIATGNGGLFQSPFEKIYALKPFQYVQFEDNASFIRNNSLLTKLSQEAPNYSKEYILKLLVEDVENNINIVSKRNNKGLKISHLTGGFDSRLILSAIYKLGYKDDYNYFCSGRKGSADKDISLLLSKHFGLTHTEYSGYKSIGNENDYTDRILKAFNFTGGLLSNFYPNIESEDNIILSGGYGELIRSFYGNKISISDYDSYSELVSRIWPNLNTKESKSIFTEEFSQKFVENFREIIQEGIELGIPEDNILDYYYQRVRNRYFVGVISFVNSTFNPRFDPLYSPIFSIAALYQPKKLRVANYFGIEMMKQFNRDLIQLPFDSPRINSEYVSLNGIIPQKSFRDNYTLKYYKHPQSKALITQSVEKKATKEHEVRANKMQAWLWQVREEENAKKGLKSILNYLNNGYLNQDYIQKLLNKEITNRVDLRTLHLLYSNLVWFYKG